MKKIFTRFSILIISLSVFTAMLVVFAGVEPSPFKEIINQISTVQNKMESIENQLEQILFKAFYPETEEDPVEKEKKLDDLADVLCDCQVKIDILVSEVPAEYRRSPVLQHALFGIEMESRNLVNCIDQLVFPMEESDWKNIRPEILITFGGMVVSKRIKQILRKYPPKHHWHIDKNDAPNTYFCLTKHFPITAQLFFSQFFFLTKVNDSDFQQNWLNIRDQRSSAHQQFLEKVPYSDFWVFDQIFKYLPDEISNRRL